MPEWFAKMLYYGFIISTPISVLVILVCVLFKKKIDKWGNK